MSIKQPVFRYLTAGLAIALLIAPMADARNRKGDKYMKDGRLAEAKREFDLALDAYEKALAEDPLDSGYQLAVRRVRFQAGQMHVERGQKIRAEGRLEEAVAEFRKAYATDPGSSIAQQELRRAEKELAEKASKETAPPTARDEAEKQLEDSVARLQALPELKPITRRITTLKMNNQPVKVLYETLGKLAGVNVIFDPEYQSSNKNYSVDLSNTTLEQALEQLGILTKTYWKALSDNTIFLTNDNVTKRRDYEDMVVQTYYLKNLTTPQELQELATILRALTDIRRVFTYGAQNIVMLRGTADQVALASKVIADVDKPRGEVVIDVIVMEANRTRTRDLAATFVSGSTNGLRLPVSFVPRAELGSIGGTTDTGTDTGTGTGSGSNLGSAVRLTKLGDIKLSDFALAIPNGLLQALMTDRGTRVLQSPQIRATHLVKSSLKIGDRFPYATGSFQPGIGAVGGVSPLVSTQFQFADVGVNVDITPTVHGSDEVSMQVEIDISNVRDRIDVGGLSQPVIGQRKFTHFVRLQQGEVSLLGGLMQDQDTLFISGTPGLANVPILRRLFSGESKERNESELLIALVPHIVRAPDIDDVNLRGIAAGSDAVVKVNYAPRPEPAKPEPPKPEAPKPDAEKPAVPAAKPAPAVGALRLAFQPEAPIATRVSESITVTLVIENAADLAGAPMRIKWDPKVLRLNDASRGALFGGVEQSIFSRSIRNDEGEVTVNSSRVPGSGGVNGSGAIVSLTFQAVGSGSTAISVAEVNLRNSQMQPVIAGGPAVTVTVE